MRGTGGTLIPIYCAHNLDLTKSMPVLPQTLKRTSGEWRFDKTDGADPSILHKDLMLGLSSISSGNKLPEN
jgi:hypothetical protein